MELVIICFLVVAISVSMYFFKARVLEQEAHRLRRRYRTNDGTDLREAYDDMIDEYNTLVRKAKKVLRDHNDNVNAYNELLERHRATVKNQNWVPPKSSSHDSSVNLGPNQFDKKEWQRILYALHPDRNGGKTNELWQKMKDLEQPR